MQETIQPRRLNLSTENTSIHGGYYMAAYAYCVKADYDPSRYRFELDFLDLSHCSFPEGSLH